MFSDDFCNARPRPVRILVVHIGSKGDLSVNAYPHPESINRTSIISDMARYFVLISVLLSGHSLLETVVYQIKEYLVQTLPVGQDTRRAFVEVQGNPDAARLKNGSNQH